MYSMECYSVILSPMSLMVPPTDMTVDYNQQEVSCLYIACNEVIMSYYRHSFMILWDLIHTYLLVTVTLHAINGGGTSGPSNVLSGRSSEAGNYSVLHIFISLQLSDLSHYLILCLTMYDSCVCMPSDKPNRFKLAL